MLTEDDFPFMEHASFPADAITWIFDGKWRPLDNFAPCRFEWNGHLWATSEHAFAASKTLDQSWAERIRYAGDPGDAKYIGRYAPLRPDWEQVKYGIMESILTAKFDQDKAAARLLLSTGGRLIFEGNFWHDQVWGITGRNRKQVHTLCEFESGAGRNALGELLMMQRERLGGEKYVPPRKRAN